MIQTNATYKSIIAADNYNVQYKFTVNGTTPYYEDDIVDGTIDETLFETLSIGNLYTKTLDCTFLPTADIPRKATIEVAFRVAKGTQVSDWYPKGTFYVSTRSVMTDGSLKIKAYDASLKGKVVFIPTGTWQETTAYNLYQELCDRLGITENTQTANYIEQNDQVIATAPDIGQNGTTVKEILCYIGTLYGKNWIVNEYNELAMIFPYEDAEEYDVADIFVSPSVTVDRLRIWRDEGSYVQYPDVSETEWEEMTGFIIEGESPYVTADNIEDIADILIGTNYVGFDASDVVEDPALQLGDGLVLDEHEVMLAHRLTVLGEDVSQCSAPYEEETENEYPDLDPVARTVAKSEARTYAYIDVKGDEIIEEVSSTVQDNVGFNLSPFFSQPFGDIYNADTNPNGYWSGLSTSRITQLTDGWAQITADNSTGTSTIWPLFYVKYVPELFNYTEDEYTILVEIKDATITGGNVDVWFSNTNQSNVPAYMAASFSPSRVFNSDTTIRGTLVKTNNSNPTEWFRCGFSVYAGVNASFKARISMYKAGYEGDYVPFIKDYTDITYDIDNLVQRVTNLSTSLQLTNESIQSQASEIQTVSASIRGIAQDEASALIGQVTTEYNTLVEQTAQGLETTISQVQTQTNANTNSIDKYERYLKVSTNDDGITIGRSNSNVRGRFDNDSLDFIDQNDVQLAWLSTQDGLGANMLSVGSSTTKSQRWNIVTSNDGNYLRFTRHS